MQVIVDIASWICLIAGSFFFLSGALGILRFPDFWARLHAASVADSGGMILIILGLCLQSGFSLVTAKLIIIGAFLFVTGPTATHAVASAALVTGWRPRLPKDVETPDALPFSNIEEPKVR